MATYQWIDVGGERGYSPLAAALDAVFQPEAIARRLAREVTDAVQSVLVEHGYVDKDYRSTLYSFYAKKGRVYRRDCVRLHFFNGSVKYDEVRTDIACADGRLEDHYFGYVVLRPTMRATLGRSVLSPGILAARGSAIQSEHRVNVLGHVLPVWGFPSMAQPADIAVCAHVSCWAILRHYSERFPQHREYLIGDMARLASAFDPGGLVPSLGLTVWEAERVFQAAGCFPLVVTKKKGPDGEPVEDEGFYGQLMAYLESGFPLFVEIRSRRHAAVAVGYSWRDQSGEPTRQFPHAWDRVAALLMVDDNRLPYRSVPREAAPVASASGSYAGQDIDRFIVALPEKIHFPADAVDEWSHDFADAYAVAEDQVVQRRWFMTTISELRRHAREHASQTGDTLLRVLMELESAQYVWVVEFCSLAQWEKGHVTGRAILDATASKRDPVATLLLHDEELAIVFDRTKALGEHRKVHLRRPSGAPLPRMELNLRQVVGV